MSFINQLNLPDEEKRVYELLLAYGKLTVAEISQYANISYKNAESALASLVEKKAAGISEGYIKKYFARIPLEHLTSTSAQISEQIQKYLTETNEKVASFKTALESKKASIISKLQEDLTNYQNNLSQIAQQTTETAKNSINTTATNVQTAVKDFASKLESTIEQSTQTTLNALNNYQAQVKEKLQVSSQTIDSEVRSIVDQNIKTIETQQQKIEEAVKQKNEQLNTVTEPIDTTMNEILQTFEQQTDEVISIFKNSIDASELDIREYLKTQTDKYLAFSQEVIQNAGGTIDSTTNKVTQGIQELNNKLDNIINAKGSEMLNQIQETLNELGQKLAEIKDNMVKELIEQKNNTISLTINNIKEDSAANFTNLQNSEQQQKNNVISERDMFFQKIETKHQQTLSSYNEAIEKIKITVKDRFAQFSNSMKDQIQDIISQVHNLLSNQQTEQVNILKQFHEEVTAKLTESSRKLIENITQVSSEIESLVSSEDNKLQSEKEQVKQSLQKVINDLNITLSSQHDTLLNQINEVIDSIKRESDQILLRAKESIDSGLQSEIAEVVNYIDSAQQHIHEEGKQLLGVTLSLHDEFKTIEGTTKEMPIPQVKTATIIGKYAIQKHIEEIVKRTKRRVTVVVPSLDYIPVDIIKELSATTKVNLVLGKSIDVSDTILRELGNVQANVEVLAPRSIGMQEEALYIGAERDNEEILIGSVDEATNEIVAIASDSTYFSELLSKLILSDAMRGKEKIKLT